MGRVPDPTKGMTVFQSLYFALNDSNEKTHPTITDTEHRLLNVWLFHTQERGLLPEC
jgi:hypothetical protein